MEIFLLVIIILLMVISQSSRNTKMSSLEEKLSGIEKYLKSLHLSQLTEHNRKKEEVKKETRKAAQVVTPPVVVPPLVVPPPVPPVIVPEVIVPPVVPPPVVPEQVVPPVVMPQAIIPPFMPVALILPVREGKNILSQKFVLPFKMAKKKNVKEQPVKEQPVKIMQEEKPPVKVQPPVKPLQPLAPQESWYDTFRKNNPDLEKFIGENILSKVAITILVIGIAFFVKYAIDKDWINETARVGIGILCGGIVLAFAHSLHKKFAAFSSVLVAGGISIFYFTIGFAFHQYHLFSQTTAFIIMLVITGFSVFISIAYDRIELAALSLVGGFATPFMVSTGQGNYQVLFIYVLILDAGMLVLAYLRRWNLINIMTYCFTMVLYISWLETKVIGAVNGPYMGALIFGAAFYIIFILMNIVNNVKEKRQFGALELSILISNTFLYFGEGLHILNNYHPEAKGVFSASLAVFNLICSWLLFKKFKADKKLVYMMIGLTLTFITVSVPIQLHGNYITLVWAFESVMLIWLAQRSKINLYRLTSILITILMFVSLFMDWAAAYSMYHVNEGTMNIIFNKGCLTGIFSALCLAAIGLLLKKETRSGEAIVQPKLLDIEFNPRNYAIFMDIAAVVVLYISGMFELVYQLNERTDGKIAFSIILCAYHLVFLSVFNFVLPRSKHRYVDVFLYYFNAASIAVFVLGFAILPIGDFKENIIGAQVNYSGFLFHYVNLAAVIFLAMRMQRLLHKKVIAAPVNPAVYSAIISIAIVYVCSIELVLHVVHLTMRHVTDFTTNHVILKLSEFSMVTVDVFKIGFPILWGLLAFAFLSFGMRRHNKTFRISGLLLIAVIVVKLFTYDIKDASEAGKIVAFIILGVVLLIISFMYQKIKALLIDDSKKKEGAESGTEDKINIPGL